MLVEQVDPVGAQAPERRVAHGANALRPAVLPVRGIAIREAELGGDDDLVAHWRQCLADQLLVAAVSLGRVEKGDAALERRLQQADGVCLVRNLRVAVAQPHASEAKR